MREILRLLAAGAVAVAGLHALGLPPDAPLGVAAPAYAQQQVQQQAPTKQIKLTEKQVEGFIAVQKKMATAKGEADEAKRIIASHREDVGARVVRLRDEFDELQVRIGYRFRDRGLLAYHMNDVYHALKDLEAYLKIARMTEQDDEGRKETEQVWEHVKTLRRRVAQLN